MRKLWAAVWSNNDAESIPTCMQHVSILLSMFPCWVFSPSSSVCSLVLDVPLFSPARRVINGSHTFQTNMEPMVAMGTASAAPQEGGVKRGRGMRSGMWGEKQEGGEVLRGVWWMEREEIEKEGGRREGGEKPTSIHLKYLIQQKRWPWSGRQSSLSPFSPFADCPFVTLLKDDTIVCQQCSLTHLFQCSFENGTN